MNINIKYKFKSNSVNLIKCFNPFVIYYTPSSCILLLNIFIFIKQLSIKLIKLRKNSKNWPHNVMVFFNYKINLQCIKVVDVDRLNKQIS